MNYSIRKAAERDERALKDLLIRNGQKPGIVIDEKSVYYLVAAGEIFGMAGAEISGTAALIRSLAVLAPYRGNGIAGELVDRLLRELRVRSVTRLYLFSRDAGEYWKRKGFVGCDVREVAERMADAPQVAGYLKDGSIWTDVAWCRDLSPVIPMPG